MSNIFEALQRGNGQIPELVLPDLSTSPIASKAIVSEEPVVAHTTTPPPPPIPQPNSIRCLPLALAAASPLLPFDETHWEASEQYRILRTRIIQHPKQPRVIVISSGGSGDGKSVTAINIAGALALKANAQVLLVDGDFRRSTIHAQLGLEQSPGLGDVLEGTATLQQAMVRAEQMPNLYILPAGMAKLNPVELLDSKHWADFMTVCREKFRYIIVDSPPVAAVADYTLIEASCDGVIIVARPDHTDRRMCLKALQTVAKEKLLGVALNGVQKWFLGRYTSGDYYDGAKKYYGQPARY